MLVIGFALHNGTEGFGIVGPFASTDQRPSWGFLVLVGLIGGGPTFLGTVIGNSFVNDTLFLAFLALAAGSILYVVIQLLKMAIRLGQTEALDVGAAGRSRPRIRHRLRAGARGQLTGARGYPCWFRGQTPVMTLDPPGAPPEADPLARRVRRAPRRRDLASSSPGRSTRGRSSR